VATRKPDKYTGLVHDLVKPIKVDAFDAASIQEALEKYNIDLVFSCLAFLPDFEEKIGASGHLKFCKAAVAAMKAAGKTRLIQISTWNSNPSSRTCCQMGCCYYCILCMISGIRKAYDSHWASEEFLMSPEAEGINWTSCRSPILEMGPHGVKDWVVEIDGDTVPSANYFAGSRDDTAQFMFDAVHKSEYFGHAVAFQRTGSGCCVQPFCCC